MTTSVLDMDGRYTVDGSPGVAFYLLGYDTEMTEERWLYVGGNGDDRCDEDNYVYFEPEEVENRDRVRAVMVGDDRVHVVDVDDLTLLNDEDYCSCCGQVGCGWG